MNCPLLVNISVPVFYLVPTIKYLSPAINTERDFSRIHSSGWLVLGMVMNKTVDPALA